MNSKQDQNGARSRINKNQSHFTYQNHRQKSVWSLIDNLLSLLTIIDQTP